MYSVDPGLEPGRESDFGGDGSGTSNRSSTDIDFGVAGIEDDPRDELVAEMVEWDCVEDDVAPSMASGDGENGV